MAALAVAVAVCSPALAATWNGNGSNDFWMNGANWGGAAPIPPEALIFTGGTRLAPINDFASGTKFDAVRFKLDAKAFTLGGNAMVLGGNLQSESTSAQKLTLPVTLSALSATETHGTHLISGGGGLSLDGALLREKGSAARFVTGSGPIHTSLSNNAAGILGGWAVVGSDWAAVNASGNIVPYVGYTSFSGGSFPAGVNSNSNVRWSGGATLTIPANTELNTFTYTEGNLANRTVNLSGTLRFANGGGIYRTSPISEQEIGLELFGGNVTAGAPNAPAEFFVHTNAAAASHNRIINFANTSLIDNGPSGPVTLVKTGPGAIRFNNPNTYSGGTYLQEGTVRAQANVATAFGTGPIYVADGAQLYINNTGIAPNNVFLTGVGIVEELYTGGAFRIASTGGAISGTITLTGDVLLGSRGAQTTTGTGARFIGRITGNHNLSLNVRTGQGNATTLNMPTMTLESPLNDWGGNTTIGRGRVRIGGDGEVIPHGSGKGNVIILGEADVPGDVSRAPSVLNLNSRTETVNGLLSDGIASRAIVENTTGGGAATLRVGANDASATFGGIIRNGAGGGAINFAKTGGGVQTLSGANIYTGTTNIQAGTLRVNGSHSGGGQYTVQAGATLGGTGTITTAAGVIVLGSVNPGASVGQITVNSNVTFGSSGRLTIELNGDTIDRLAINGNLMVAPGAELELLVTGLQSQQNYTFLTHTGQLSGAFSSMLLPPGYRLGQGDGQLILQIVPEPSTMALVGLAVCAILSLRHRLATQ